jgi:hypothetical protein
MDNITFSIDDDKKDFSKECEKYPYLPTIVPKTDRIVVFGDLHGDWDLTIKCLKGMKLIDDDLKWVGNKTVIVQVGDQIDRCRPVNKKCDHPQETVNDENSDIKILEFLTNLHSEAKAVGGAVYSLFGNHEFMNIEGNMNYVSYDGLVGFADYDNGKFREKYSELPDVEIGKLARKHAFSRGNEYATFLGCTRIATIIVGSFLFVHAGITPEIIKKLDIKGKNDLYKINYAIRRWVLKLINKDYVDKIINSDEHSMFWQRILGDIPPNINNFDPRCVKYIEPVLKLFNIGHMVIGHTPQFVKNKSGINNTCGDSLWRVDIGASNAFSKFVNGNNDKLRKAQVLEILNDTTIKIVDI